MTSNFDNIFFRKQLRKGKYDGVKIVSIASRGIHAIKNWSSLSRLSGKMKMKMAKYQVYRHKDILIRVGARAPVLPEIKARSKILLKMPCVHTCTLVKMFCTHQ